MFVKLDIILYYIILYYIILYYIILYYTHKVLKQALHEYLHEIYQILSCTT